MKILRAFASAFKDPELKAEAERRSYEVGLAAGEEMEKLAKEVMALPPAVLERMKKYRGIMLGPGITARHVAFALFYSPPRRGRARVGVHRNMNSAMRMRNQSLA